MREDLIGQKFGRLLIQSVEQVTRKTGGPCWVARCLCDCGRSHTVKIYNLKSTLSCGCYRSDSVVKRRGERGICIGDTLERLTVLEVISASDTRNRTLRCKCMCGNETFVREKDFEYKTIKSCGCFRAERMAGINKTHGEYRTPLHTIWQHARERCSNKNNPRYGGRGIKMFPEWEKDFLKFKEYVDSVLGERPGDRYSLDRIDNDKDYEPGNIRWASPKEQARNKSSNRLITFEGETLCLTDWARRIGISSTALRQRIKLGWSIEKALKTPSIK